MKPEEKRIACKIDINDIIAALHKKAIEKSSTNEYKIINSAISGEGESSKFSSGGKNIISILPVNDRIIIDKKKCYDAIIKYIKFFNGSDIADNITIDDLKPLTEPVKIVKDKKEKDTVSESLMSKLFESDDEIDILKANGQKVIGYYVMYGIDIGSQRETTKDDPWERLKKGIKSQLSEITITTHGLWGTGKSYKLGNLMNDMDYKSIDATKLPGSVRQQFANRYPELHPDVSIIDSGSLIDFLKNQLNRNQIDQISAVNFDLCIKITKRDKTYNLISKQEIADVVTNSISRSGIGNIINPNDVDKEDVIYINNYSDELKSSQSKHFIKKDDSNLNESKINKIGTMVGKLINSNNHLLNEYVSNILSNDVMVKKVNNVINLFRDTRYVSLSNYLYPLYKEQINDNLKPTIFDAKVKRATHNELLMKIENYDIDTGIQKISADVIEYLNNTDKPMNNVGTLWDTINDYRDTLEQYDFSDISSSHDESGRIVVNSKINPKITDISSRYDYYIHNYDTKDGDYEFINTTFNELSANDFHVEENKKDQTKKLFDVLKSKRVKYNNINDIEQLISKIKESLNAKVITKQDLANILGIKLDYEKARGSAHSGKSQVIEPNYIDYKFKQNGIDFTDFTSSLRKYINVKYPTLEEQKNFLKTTVKHLESIKGVKKDIEKTRTDWDCYIIPLENLKYPDVEPDTLIGKNS